MLAGGRASRFGGINKALIEIEGVPIINRTIKILEPLFSEIIIAGWSGSSPLPAGVIPVDDNFPGLGPLGGIETGLKICSSPLLFVFGGDMPWLSAELIREQAEEMLREPAGILAARIGGLAEPLHSVYSRSLHGELARYLQSGARPAVIDFYKLVHIRYYDLPRTVKTLKAFTNINSPGDISNDLKAGNQ
ncbi:MAG: molybdenum cofactor guanylyltransferase [Bacteroidales bacterium]|nr:molybdenum cofactor guanylyltransferase [Bacteroidales bacterium]